MQNNIALLKCTVNLWQKVIFRMFDRAPTFTPTYDNVLNLNKKFNKYVPKTIKEYIFDPKVQNNISGMRHNSLLLIVV